MAFSKRTTGYLAVLAAVVGLATLSPAVAAHADTEEQDVTVQTVCGDSINTDIRGAEAYWHATCTSTEITISGWVEDTKANGLCARVRAYINGKWHYSPKACPAGEVENFVFTGVDRAASVYLYNT